MVTWILIGQAPALISRESQYLGNKGPEARLESSLSLADRTG
jgi:hypothetical protein